LQARLTKFTARDIRKKEWKEFSRERDRGFIEDVLNYLEAMNWIELREESPGKSGGRPTIAAHVNPRVFEEFAGGLGAEKRAGQPAGGAAAPGTKASPEAEGPRDQPQSAPAAQSKRRVFPGREIPNCPIAP
jgi:hypothetical protein